MERDLRCYRDQLISIGSGVQLLGTWSAIKLVLTAIADRKELYEMLYEEDVSDAFTLGFTIVFITIIIMLIIGTHYTIGMNACAEGHGKKKSNGYIVITAVFILLYLFGLFLEIFAFSEMFEHISMGFVTIFIDITTLVSLIELLYAVYKVRTISKELEQG